MTRVDKMEHFLLNEFKVSPIMITKLVENAFSTAFKHFSAKKDILKPTVNFLESLLQSDPSQFPCNGKFYYLTFYENYLIVMYFKNLVENTNQPNYLNYYTSFFQKLDKKINK